MEIIFITYHDDTLCGCDTFIAELSQPLSETDGANVKNLCCFQLVSVCQS